MRLLVVTNENSPLLETRGNDCMYLPGSVPAYLALEKAGKPILTVSASLSPKDYQEVWQECLVATWQKVQESLLCELPGRPNLIAICAYSIYLTLAQSLILGRVLDGCRKRAPLEEIRIDGPTSAEDDGYIFWSGLYTSCYREVITAWAAENGIPCQLVPRPVISSVAKSRGRNAGVGRFRKWPGKAAVIASSLRRPLNFFWRRRYFPVLVARMKGHRVIIFHILGSLVSDKESPLYCINLEWFVRWFGYLAAFLKKLQPERSRLATEYLRIQESIETRFGWAGRVTMNRFRKHTERTYPVGQMLFHFFVKVVRFTRRLGLHPALVAFSPYTDFDYQGFIADAFRREKANVAEVVHGGNFRLVRRGGLPTILTNGLADFCFQWNNACKDEHREYGIETAKPIYVDAGSLRSAQLERMAQNTERKRGDDKPVVVYAPTFVSVQNTVGMNVVWDSYLSLVRRALAILNTPRIHTIVSYVQRPEVHALLDSGLYPDITFRPYAFSQVMWQSDYLVVDSLAGSPIYEALLTDKPILLYAGIENQVWDEEFLEKLARRAICFLDTNSYLEGLSRFVSDPEGYVTQAGVGAPRALAEEYLPGVEVKQFWKIVEETFVSRLHQ